MWNVTWRFDDVERVLLNSMMKDKILDKFSKEEAIALLYINVSASPETDSKYFNRLIDKIEKLSDDDWEFIKSSYPLWVSCAAGTSKEAKKADDIITIDT